MPDIDTPHSKFPHVYAIVRLDLYEDRTHLENCVAVVKVFSSEDLAEQEAARLNAVNKDKKCSYIVQTTRFIGSLKADGRR